MSKKPLKLKRGDLVACYITNTDVYEALLQWGLVLDVNENVDDVLALDNEGCARWWPAGRWRHLSPSDDLKKKEKYNGI